MQYTVAVDVGGTKIAVGIMNEEGKWLAIVKVKSDTSSAMSMYDSLLGSIYDAIEQVNLSKKQIGYLGVAIPGQLDIETGLAIYQNNLPWENFPLGDLLVKEFPTSKLIFEHDVVAAALGEWSVRELTEELLVYVTVSTGISASIISKGKPQRGEGGAGEIGLFPVSEGELLETYASGSAMERELSFRNKGGSLVDAFNCWEAGDKDFADFFEKRAYQLAVALIMITATLDPSKIVLGGGVINNQQNFFRLINYYYQLLCKHPVQKNWSSRIETSTLRGKAGLFGIAMKARGTI